MFKELIQIWLALCLNMAFAIMCYVFLSHDIKDLKKNVNRLNSVTFDSARCYKDIAHEQGS